MATFTGTSTNVVEMVKSILTFLCDPATFGSGNEWKLVYPAIISDVADNIIIKGVGDGEDDIYIGMSIKPASATGQIDVLLNGFAGYDAGLEWREQPGGINHVTVPTMSLLKDTFMTFWVSATTSRIIIVVELSTQYEGCYLGLMKPIAIERQYPYPLVIGGSYYEGGLFADTGPGHSIFANPGTGIAKPATGDYSTSLRIRRPDGSWRSGYNRNISNVSQYYSDLCVWPTNTEPVRTLTVYDDVLTLENVIMFPFLLYESKPVGLIGQLDGIFWIGNREDISAKDNILYNNKIYKVFNNVYRRDNDQYFAIEWA